MAYVYILQSKRDGRYYVGSTVDLKSRLAHHKSGYTHSTKRFGDFDLVLFQEYESLKKARDIERKIKLLKRKDYVRRMVEDGYIKLGL